MIVLKPLRLFTHVSDLISEKQSFSVLRVRQEPGASERPPARVGCDDAGTLLLLIYILSNSRKLLKISSPAAFCDL